jgi:hypothetical protein
MWWFSLPGNPSAFSVGHCSPPSFWILILRMVTKLPDTWHFLRTTETESPEGKHSKTRSGRLLRLAWIFSWDNHRSMLLGNSIISVPRSPLKLLTITKNGLPGPTQSNPHIWSSLGITSMSLRSCNQPCAGNAGWRGTGEMTFPLIACVKVENPCSRSGAREALIACGVVG